MAPAVMQIKSLIVTLIC